MMKITLTAPARVMMPAGTELELEDSVAMGYVRAGVAVQTKTRIVEKAVKAPAERRNKTK